MTADDRRLQTNGPNAAHAHAVSEPLRVNAAHRWSRRQWLDLFLMLVRRDVTIKYKQSIMGLLWAILMPSLIVCAGLLVRVLMVRLTGSSELGRSTLVEIAVKSVPWAFVVGAIRFATNSLVANAALVTKIYMPREVFPIAAVGSHFFDLAVATVPLAVAVSLLGAPFTAQLLWVPILLTILVGIIAAAGLVLSAASLFFRDVKYLVEVGLMFGVFVTPVFFEAHQFGDWERILMLNPVAPILEGLAAVVGRGAAPPLPWIGYSAVVAAVGLVAGYRFFKALEPRFAESI